jgi:ParB family chromosome partitioning protein
MELPLTAIDADPQQLRKVFRNIESLAKGILKHGLQQPILVRPNPETEDRYIIINGERRFRAHQLANLPSIKCFIKTNLSIEEVRDLQLIENLDRENLSDMELAKEFRKRIERGQTQEEIADRIGQNRGFVQQRLALLKLSVEIQERVLNGEISFSNARKLLEIKDTIAQSKIASQVTADTTFSKMNSLVKQENVTRVTKNIASQGDIKVSELATYQLINNKETVPQTAFLEALGADLKFLRGE